MSEEDLSVAHIIALVAAKALSDNGDQASPGERLEQSIKVLAIVKPCLCEELSGGPRTVLEDVKNRK